ncbi:BRISC and BRCA1-A complex member 2-like [Aricia agestis]|uniref:BRISC and BRCA1-A complex member 2-like n=1 Tax=Aricia agestis TaxID=91739 RepID=UPI001C20495D|nr:BRISC and BRCA1-A complex member 2-like [Aricia agestis]XP_041976586.1 BRISC and BRCA1-A complex member 2-like [Aricia agestis]
MTEVDDISIAFRPYVETIYTDLRLGLCKSKIEIEKIGSNSKGNHNQFRLLLPYCSRKLKWEVIFDSSVPWFAPDFRFDDDSFFSNVDEDFIEKSLPSLAQWNPSNLRSLNNVLTELICFYKTYQVKKLNEDPNSRASFEYNALLGNALTTEEDVEVFVGNHTVEFLIKLKVDTSRLPEIYNDGINENPGIDTALLLVRYPNSTNAELILSPFLTKVLGNITLPPMHQNGVLMDYVPLVTEILNKKVQDLLNNDKLKRELLAQIIVKYEGAILEHDASSVALLFEMNDFHWILQIDIGLQFPDKPPVLTLRSVYHCTSNYPYRKPRTKVLPSCPYNNFEGYIAQQVEIFKTECKGTSTQPLLDIDN